MKRRTKAFAKIRPAARRLRGLVACGAVFLAAALQCSAADTLPAGVEVRTYAGWQNAIFLNANERPIEAIVAADAGGTVVRYAWNDENILFENPAAAGKLLGPNHAELWLGGYQCDVGPRGAALPPHLPLLEGRYGWDLTSYGTHVTSEPDPDLGIVLEKNFVIAADTGDLGIIQHMRNVSDKPVSYSFIDRTHCKGGGFILVPMNKQSRYSAGWARRRTAGGRTWYDGDSPDAPQARVMDGVLVVSATGPVTALGADPSAGWIAYVRGNLLYVKYFPCYAAGRYAEAGNRVEIYFDSRIVELSPLSPVAGIAPGGEFVFPEKWQLIPLKKPVKTTAEARKLVQKIKPSPF